ncbi:hypothetical protein H4R21_005444, partial [Coemansia helicoidea]
MASNAGAHPAFRRATGKVATPGSGHGAGGHATLIRRQQNPHYQPDRPSPTSQHHGYAAAPSHPQPYAAPNHPQPYGAPGFAPNSAIPAPRDPRLQPSPRAQPAQLGPYQPPHDPHPGYYSSVTPSGMYPHGAPPPPPPQQQQQQQQQQYWQDSGNPQPYYQQTIGQPVYGEYADNTRQPARGAEAQSAAALPAAFQQMNLGAPLAPRQHMSVDATRRREQALEDAYDRDDGHAGADVDASLFPANAAQ